MANKNNINTFQNNNTSFDILPSYFNNLNNFNTIYYEGAIIPRIRLNSNDSKNIERLFYYPIEDVEYYILNESRENNNFGKKESLFEININSKEKIQINNIDENFKCFLNNEKKDNNNKLKKNFINEKQENIKYIFNEKTEIMPPKNITSIINNGNKNININMNNNDYKNINNILLDNVHLLYNNRNISTNNKELYCPKIINQINNQTIFNFNIFDNISLLEEQLTKSLINKNRGKPLFIVYPETNKQNLIHQKRGRKTKRTKKNYREHKGSDDDNLLRKIQVHFLSFVINYTNDLIKNLSNIKKVPIFKPLDYKIKRNINHKFVEYLKSKNISDILQLSVSPKYKKHGDNVNKKIYNKVCTKFPFMTKFFGKSYLSLFREYYYNNKFFFENGKIIQLSNKTQTFNDLIIKDSKYKDQLNYLVLKKIFSR